MCKNVQITLGMSFVLGLALVKKCVNLPKMAQGKLENLVSSACLKKSILLLIVFVINVCKCIQMFLNVEKLLLHSLVAAEMWPNRSRFLDSIYSYLLLITQNLPFHLQLWRFEAWPKRSPFLTHLLKKIRGE